MNIKRYLTTGLAVACLVLGAAAAQNIVKSVQLSQDPTGGMGVDALGGVFFPNHVSTAQPATPTVVGFGAGTPSITGTDSAGEVVEGTGAVTSGTLTFARAYNATPYCTGTSNAAATPVAFYSSPNGFNVAHPGTSVLMRFYYQCVGGRTG